MSLSAEEFWHICNSIAGPRTTIDKATLYSAICCAGKSVIRSHLNNLWPTDKDEVDLEHAFRIFDRLEDLVVDQSDLAKIRRDGIEVEVEQLLEQLPTERREKVKQSLKPFTHNGKLNLEESFGGVLFTRPLRVVKHVLEGHGPCRVALKIVRNGDMRPDAFDNDVFGVVTDNSGRSYRTEEFQLEHGFTFTVMGLGTTIQNPSKDKQRVDLTANGKLSKRFKFVR
ncbi:unnamed protein product [Nippostrongylus brasiliensis]|uniref:HEPN_Toprim_N domain-containing protein n=1 Tax=Nippostrongylus brasiliensis TaxID=27835 RepID=A0A158QYP1_NIPBR|nr:unnamed protein product [Nippostrongylus brasiliensis]